MTMEYLRKAEENEVRRILYELTALAACYHAELRENIRVMENLKPLYRVVVGEAGESLSCEES